MSMLKLFEKTDVRLSQSPSSNSISFFRVLSLFSDQETQLYKDISEGSRSIETSE